MKFHISRWHFWWGYFLILVLIVVAIWLLLGGSIKWFLLIGAFALVLLVIFEILLYLERVTITESGIEFRKGILSRHVTRTSYHSISNVFIRQSLIQRILHYGTVEIDTAGGPEPEVTLHNFQSPTKVEQIIDSHIRKLRKHGHVK